ncbi:AraC family transcriptional regulator [Sphaerochaeta globosa]|uniref:Transcriptional regulator, AraC family n=1 Tax=Sphaerochaeta globosa (strain ATCC BAA-1886 / DSM 22777 / Buddy) TaxID=158189 RepID=F0RUB0_SPHGB|nr:AraC family transcriptional regulator [Sphaerochaeta globosa]ADY12272.1 transcriptional regulator, AraC family [Sphaerochaeta globosa str. Buddy]
MSDEELLIKAARFVGLDGVKKSAIDLALSYCGIQQCSPLHNNGPEIRDTSFIHIVSTGKGVLKMDGKEYHLQSNQAFLIPSGVSAQYTADKDDPWHYMWVGFSGLMSEESMAMAGFSREHPVRSVLNEQLLLQDIEGMIETYHLTFTNELRRNGCFFHFISHLIEDYQAQGSLVGESSLQCAQYARNAYHFIMEHFSEPIKIQELAEQFGVSRNYLYACFKEVYKVSPKQFLNAVRMEHASSLLLSKYLYVSQVAHQVGFDDELAFSKAFKEFHALSPTDFRKQLRSHATKPIPSPS